MKLALLFKLGIYKIYAITIEGNVEKIQRKWTNTLSEKEMHIYDLISGGVNDDMHGYHENYLYAVFKKDDDTGIRIKHNDLDRSIVSAVMKIGIDLYTNRYYETKHGETLMFLDGIDVAKTVLSKTENWKSYKTNDLEE